MKRILVIEDEPALRANLAHILRRENFQPLTAVGGREGILTARRELPDLILCDILMPDVNGFRVLEEIRADETTARIPFVFLTAKGEPPDLRTGMNLGADDYLIKPVHVDDLLAAIEARLERAQQIGGTDLDLTSARPLESLGLTGREAEILLEVARGKTNKEIAADLGISTGTVRKHAENIYRSLAVTTRNAAALRAIQALTRKGG